MTEEVFVISVGLTFLILFIWSFRTLPTEGWQILATVPVTKMGSDRWKGLNLTFYGVFISLATVLAVSFLIALTSAIMIPVRITLVIAALTLIVGFSASKIVALLVEKKRHTFTVAGASFGGLLATPIILASINHFLNRGAGSIAVIPFIASMAIAYAIGEGIGRLACISFGCCYGKPLSDVNPWIQRLLGRCPFVFAGKLKKIAYEKGMDGQKVVPVQAMTSCLYVATGLVATLLFLKNEYCFSLILVTVITQSWRVISETLRADYRGPGHFTAYQLVSLLIIGFVLTITIALRGEPLPVANLELGLRSLWDPTVILFLQFVGLASFFYTGRSMVTGSTISFHVLNDRI
ncbi:MAG: prolipoprotein diacylglyceryl transferase family protein [Pseudomonadota bacterium]